AMHDGLLMRSFENLGHLLRNRQHLVEQNRALGDPMSEYGSLDELRDKRRRTGRILEPVHVGNVRVIQRGEQVRFLLEPVSALMPRLVGQWNHNNDYSRCHNTRPGLKRCENTPRLNSPTPLPSSSAPHCFPDFTEWVPLEG